LLTDFQTDSASLTLSHLDSGQIQIARAGTKA
jgi:hypothetical protein